MQQQINRMTYCGPDDFQPGSSLYSIDQLSPEALNYLVQQSVNLREAEIDLKARRGQLLRKVTNKLMTDELLLSVFLEPSTRTRVSTEIAAHNLGMPVVTVEGKENNSLIKGESMDHMLRMFAGYNPDLIIIRSGVEGLPEEAAGMYPDISWINGGDGRNEHPTQTLVDLVTIQQRFGRLTGLTVALAGDLKNGRTTRSLAKALAKLGGNKIIFIAPDSLQIDPVLMDELNGAEIEHANIEDLALIMPDVDLLYGTRPQTERMSLADQAKYPHGVYQITPEMVADAPDLYIMHPLPIDTHKSGTPEVDPAVEAQYPNNIGYFDQAANGVATRMVVLMELSGQGQQLAECIREA